MWGAALSRRDEPASRVREHLVDLEQGEQIYLVICGKVTLK